MVSFVFQYFVRFGALFIVAGYYFLLIESRSLVTKMSIFHDSQIKKTKSPETVFSLF